MRVSTGRARAALRSFAGGWAWSLAGQSVQLLAQAAAFIVLARDLGVGAFGIWASLSALCGLTSHLVGAGFGNLLIRETARDATRFRAAWGNALLVTLATGVILAAIGSGTAWLVLPSGATGTIVSATFASQLVFSRLVALTTAACQGLGRLREMSYVSSTLALLRLAAVLVWARLDSTHSLETWAMLNAAATAVASAAAVGWALATFPRPRLATARLRGDARDGLLFVLSPYTQAVNNDADKVILGRAAPIEAVGAYGAAYTMVSVAFVPVQALFTVTYPLFFARGRRGIESSSGLARSMAPWAIGTASVASLALLAGAPLIRFALGHEFDESARVLRWLSVLPILRAMQYLSGDSMTGADLQRRRVCIQAGAAVLNVALNIVLDPALGWRGAAIATLVSDGLLALALALGVRSTQRGQIGRV